MFFFRGSSESDKLPKVKGIDLHAAENARIHHTDEFEVTQKKKEAIPILRRGQPFSLTIDLDDDFVPEANRLVLKFIFESERSRSGNVYIEITDATEFSKDEEYWDARIVEKRERQLALEVQIPYAAMVGEYKLRVVTLLQSNPRIYNDYMFDQPIHVLFNPWCKNDQVYLPDEELLQEYVLNECGEIYMGNLHEFHPRSWYFGQFNYVVLKAVSMMLQSSLDFRKRGDAVRMARAIAHKVNDTSKSGILRGKWTGDYSGGTAPWKWTGSKKIIEEYVRTEGPVLYGQCWVFSGLTTTVCRALGIPCRSVTNFDSAHDTNESLTIDRYYNSDGEMCDYGTNEHIWNFHVWNDVWMARPDLPEGFGGWQAIDATPQEQSEGMFTCGPCSVTAIKMGNILLPYDANFISGEVNADVIHWRVLDGEDPFPFKLDTTRAGSLILTKSPWSNNRYSNHEDITSQYKHAEGSIAERSVLHMAMRNLEEPPRANLCDSVKDVEFCVKIDKVMIGEEIVLTIFARNTSCSVRSFEAILTLNSMLYTGVIQDKIKKEKTSHWLKPDEEKSFEMRVKSSEYYQKLVEQCSLVFFTLITVEETKQVFSKRNVFSLKKPELEISVNEHGQVGESTTVKFGFKNPLDRVITSLTFDIEGKGFEDVSGIYKGRVEPYGQFEHEVNIVPIRTGQVNLVATVNCDEIFDLTNKAAIKISS